MKNIIYIILVAFGLSGCHPLRFDRYPGISHAEFPEDFRGKYEFYNNSIQPDSLSIYIGKNSYTQISKNATKIYFLDTSHVYSTYKDKHFIFWEQKEQWSGILLNRTDGQLIVTPIIPNKNTKNEKGFIEKYFGEVQLIKDEEESEKLSYYAKMNEEQLLKYLKKIKKNKFTLTKVPY